MKVLHLATGALVLGLAACGYGDNYNNETAYNEQGAAYNETGNYTDESANYSAEENYSANAMTNDMNAVVDNEVNAVTNY